MGYTINKNGSASWDGKTGGGYSGKTDAAHENNTNYSSSSSSSKSSSSSSSSGSGVSGITRKYDNGPNGWTDYDSKGNAVAAGTAPAFNYGSSSNNANSGSSYDTVTTNSKGLINVTVYGNSIDLASAKSVLSDKYCYTYVDTKNMTTQELNDAIGTNDVVVGGTAAIGGVSSAIDTNGAVRLGGWNDRDTKDVIQQWEDAGCATCKVVVKSNHSSRNSPTRYPPAPQHAYRDFDKYSYFFGVDKVQVKHMTANNTCCIVTPELYIGQLLQDEYIQLEASCITSDVNSIELYIVDGAMEIPILPIGTETVVNEKIFYGMRPRFSVDYNSEISIRKDGVISSISLESAMQLNDALYTVSYTPLDPHSCKPLNNSVKIKIIERLYEKNSSAPYATKIRVRKYGGDALWR